jgi:plastocyanin
MRLGVPIVVCVLSAMAVLPSLTSAAPDATPVTIFDKGDIASWGYGPTTTTIAVGQTITWTNSGTSPHDATSTDGSWKTPLLTSGKSASVTFSTPGTFDYSCVLHPWMKGTVVVSAAVSAPAPVPATPDTASPGTAAVSNPAPAPSTPDVAPPANPAPQSDATAPQPADGDGSEPGSGSAN